MRRQSPIAQLLYNYLYPHPSANDPTSFSAHLARNLVPEVRVEVATFYGDLNSAEARYPGLNYCHPPHRMRLGRFKHHRRLFDAFDNLGLTYNEIQDFCCWEGTKWARERYEKDEGVKVVDTTGDEIGPFVDHREAGLGGERSELDDGRRCSITRKTDISVVVEDADAAGARTQHSPAAEDEEMSNDDEDEDDDDEADHETAPIPPRTHASARPRTFPPFRDVYARRARRNPHRYEQREHEVNRMLLNALSQGHELPPELEQFLKEQSELGFTVDAASFARLSRYLASGPVAPATATSRARPGDARSSAAVGLPRADAAPA